jgi:hypothetical protein
MGSVGLVFAAGSVLVAASRSALGGSDPLEVSRQTVRLLVVRRRQRLLGCRAPEPLGEHLHHEIAAVFSTLLTGGSVLDEQVGQAYAVRDVVRRR